MNLHLTKLKKLALKLVVLLYGGKGSATLSTLPYSRYMKIAASSSVLKFQKLSFTEKATCFHYLCVYHHVQEWNAQQEGSSNCGFGHIYQGILNGKFYYFVQCQLELKASRRHTNH